MPRKSFRIPFACFYGGNYKDLNWKAKAILVCLFDERPVIFWRRRMYLEINDPVDYRTALYVRLSKEDVNEGRSEGVTGQKSMLEEFVGQNRLKVYDTYIDDGWSGANFAGVR